MELDQFVEHLSGKPLTEQQKEWLELAKSKSPTGRTRVCVVGDRFNPGTAISNLLHEDFNRLEERVLADPITIARLERQMEKVVICGTRYSHCWFDEYTQIQIKDMSHHEMGIVDQTRFVPHPDVPADHPTRKREPKGPRGRWGKL